MYNSDVYDGGGIGVGSGAYPGTHSGDLTSPSINLSSYTNIALQFNQYARANASAVSTLLDISTNNGATWTNIPINATVVGNGSTSNDDVQLIDISAVAGGQSNVKIRFTWTGRYYYWLLDDIQILESPNNNLALTDYFYSPKSYGIPISQTSAHNFDFATRVSNIGAVTQTNVKVLAEVQDASFNTLWADSVTLAALVPGADTPVVFPNTYTPNNLSINDYYVYYYVSSDSVDFDYSDNNYQLPFEVNDSTFQMHNNISSATRPVGGGDYIIGNVYKTAPNFTFGDYQVNTVEFSCAKNASDGPLSGNTVDVFLVEVNANVNNDWSNFNLTQSFGANPNLTIVGFNSYTFGASAANYDDFSTNLTDWNTGAYGVKVKPDTRYMVFLSWSSTSNVVFTAHSSAIDRDSITTFIYTSQWFLEGFGADRSAAVSMNIDYVGATVMPSIEFTNTTTTVNEDDGAVDVSLQISNINPSNTTSVLVSLDPSSTATNGADFSFISPTTVTFPLGTSGNQTFSIPLYIDGLIDGGETIKLNILSVTNGTVGTNNSTTITINDAQPDPVIAVLDNISLNFNDTATFFALANDTLPYAFQSYNISQNPLYGTITIDPQTNSAIYIPSNNFCGMDTAYYVVCDLATCDTGMIVFTVTCPTPLIANEDIVSVAYEDTVSFNPLVNDFLPYGVVTANLLQAPINGIITIDTSLNISYIANQAVCGEDTMVYVICDAFNCDTAMVIITIGCPIYPLRTINQVNTVDALGVADSLGVLCELQGTVYGVDFRGGNGYSFTLIDATGGINAFSFDDVNGYSVTEGDMVSVKGSIDQFNGLTQTFVDSIHILGTNTLNVPTVVTTLDETTESQLVKLEAVALIDPSQWTNSGNGFNVEIRNATDTLTVRIDNNCDLFGTLAPTGWFDVTGIGGQWDNSNPYTEGYQLFPRRTSDIVLLTNTNVVDLAEAIEFFPNPTSQFLNIQATIEVKTILISNMLGQEVKMISSPQLETSINVSDLANGVYTISFITEQGVWTKEFVKQD